MRVLGIDPGSLVTGFGVVEQNRYELVHLVNGEIKVQQKGSLAAFLVLIYERLKAIIAETKPDAMAVEEVFYGKNVKSLIKQGQARGVAMLAGSHSGIPVFEYSPLAVKQAVVGYGRAEKTQVQQMVKAILNLAEVPPEDAADALAVAICHANSSGRIPKK
ncbi:MAG: Crossover junction endodeoxyribonuclease RuvC [Syntrophus sp. SKADARSKE-3]|nr:Crossover junction endodeoxyribonuclease RuvC [Syntrophus sp. SKADARSKE-3]